MTIITDGPTTELVAVDPATAAQWLENNDSNRAIKHSSVTRFAEDMAAGRWAFTGEAVQFDTQGKLVNGQHRLTAVVKSGATVPMLVVRGLDGDAQRHMDQGAKRSVADYLTMNGIKNASTVAAIGKLIIMWEADKWNATYVSNVAAQDFIEDNRIIVEIAEKVMSFIHRGLDLPPAPVGAAYFRILRAGNTDADVDEFFNALTEMRTSGEGDPKKALLQRFANRRKSNERLPQQVALSLIVRAWNFDAAGKSAYKLNTFSRNGAIQVPAPIVKGTDADLEGVDGGGRNPNAYRKEVREWATANGYDVGPSGRMSVAVVAAYEAAHPTN